MFIVIDGYDGSGKTTLCTLLGLEIKKSVIVHTKTASPLCKEIFKVISNNKMDASTEFFLFYSMFIETQKHIENALELGYTVICDRWTPSLEVYQNELYNQLHQLHEKILKPDYMFILNISKDDVHKRLQGKSLDRFELDTTQDKIDLYNNYDKGIHINAIQEKEAVLKDIIQHLI